MKNRAKHNSEPIPMSHIKKSTASKVFDAANALFMIVFCITIIFPFWDVIVRSFSRPMDISVSHLNLFPKQISLEAYEYCLEDHSIYRSVLISVARTVIGVILHLIVVSLAAYSLTRQNMPGLKYIQFFFIIPMFVGAGIIPVYLNMKSLGLINNFWVYVLPTSFAMYDCIIMRNYFYSIDKSLEESASMDGASPFRIYVSIIMPLSKPVVATVALWEMVDQWNAWFDNMMYNLQSEKLLTLQYNLRMMLNRSVNQYSETNALAAITSDSIDITGDNVKAAVTLLVVVPIVCVYPFLQKYFLQGIMVGAVKG